jgi:hypothetical protein
MSNIEQLPENYEKAWNALHFRLNIPSYKWPKASPRITRFAPITHTPMNESFNGEELEELNEYNK